MANTPLPTTDTTASTVNKTVSGMLGDVLPIVEAAIITAQPWLGWPIISTIWESFLSYLWNQIGQALGIEAGYLVMDLQQYIAVTSAANAMAALNAAKASGDANAIEQASQAVDQAVSPVLHYLGSTSSS